MKRLLLFPLMLLMLLAAGQAVAQHRSRQQAEQEIRRLEQAGIDAAMNWDWKFFDRLLMPDWTAIDPSGRQIDKVELISEYKKVAAKPDKPNLSMRMYDVSIRFLSDDVVLVTCRITTTTGGRVINTRGSDVYVWHAGRWMVGATQTTVMKGT